MVGILEKHLAFAQLLRGSVFGIVVVHTIGSRDWRAVFWLGFRYQRYVFDSKRRLMLVNDSKLLDLVSITMLKNENDYTINIF